MAEQVIKINLTPKQTQAWGYLEDNITSIVLYGGAAGAGKSWLGCLWITNLCLTYPGIRTLIGRTVLQQLKMTTLNTLFETLQTMGLKSGTDYTYNGQSNIITFSNASEIVLKDLQHNPSDANFDSLGGLELTACFVDEAAQISNLAYNILKSRIRYKLNEYGLIPKMLMTCNPAQNWLKKEFYIPYIQETLDNTKAFIPALPLDNNHLPDSYIEMLKTLPPQQRKRLLEGNWDYLDDFDSLFDFDSISNSVFKLAPNENDKRYISLDVARYGSDRSVAVVWVGNVIINIYVYSKLSAVELADEIKELIQKHKVHPKNIIVDADGVGGPVSDVLRGTDFVNNSSPLHGQNFSNLKSQCYSKLADMFKEGKISINILEPAMIDELTQELLSVKLKNLDKDNKIAVQSKDEMKRLLGKSPDLSDAVMMKMIVDIKAQKTTGRYAISFV
jgi:PBSX family phage terminase large subunit